MNNIDDDSKDATDATSAMDGVVSRRKLVYVAPAFLLSTRMLYNAPPCNKQGGQGLECNLQASGS